MNTHDLIFVTVPDGNCVVGFEPEEIAAFEKDLAALRKTADVDYWPYFSFVFADALRGQEATGFSALWRFDAAWTNLERLRA